MKYKGLYTLLIILGVLILVTWIYREQKKPPKSLKLLSDFGEIEKIVLSRKDSTITLELAGGEWRITTPIEAPTDKKVMSEFVDILNRIELGEAVTKRPEMYGTFGVDEEGTKISIYSSSDSISFTVGKTAGFDEGYIRLIGEDAVRLSKGFPRYLLSRGLDYWRDKTILSIQKNDIERIDFNYGSESFSLVKDGGWKLDGADVDSNKVKPLLATLENFRADGFLNEGEFEPEVTIEVKRIGGESQRILIGKSTDHRYPVMREGTETVFLVSSWKVDRLKKKASDFQ